jgi:hypothetical protein
MENSDIDTLLGKRISTRARHWLIVLFSILALLILLLLLEVLLRAFGLQNPVRYEPVPSPDLFAHDDTLGWVLRPGASGHHASYEYSVSYSTDNHGFRYVPASITGNRPIICCLGGSMTFGHGLNDEDTFPNRLAEYSGGDIWNLGVQGYATDQSWIQLKRVMIDLQPDVVILSYLPSHIERNACLPKWVDKLKLSHRTKPCFGLVNGELVLQRIPRSEVDNRHPNPEDWQLHRTPSGGFFLSSGSGFANIAFFITG